MGAVRPSGIVIDPKLCVHGHEVIIAVTRAEVTPRHNFVIPSRDRHLDRSLNALSTSADASVRCCAPATAAAADIRLGVQQVRDGARTAARYADQSAASADSDSAADRMDWEWSMALGIAIAAALYIAGLVVLHRRGDRWPVRRSLSFLLGGLGSIALATMSALGTYDTVLFSVHMVQHMILMMVAPLFLALGAPVTLALRTRPLDRAPCCSPCCTRGSPEC